MTTEHSYMQSHAHFLPTTLGSVAVKKFMVGNKMLGEAQYDLTPEQAAVRLRNVSDALYLGSECDQ